jgi:hypothetical protein
MRNFGRAQHYTEEEAERKMLRRFMSINLAKPMETVEQFPFVLHLKFSALLRCGRLSRHTRRIKFAQSREHLPSKQGDVGDRVGMVEEAALAEHQ